jgi:predicted transcriptional regulator
MNQQAIYKNAITREIGGVIYSNDDRHLIQELEEYVLTKELMKPKMLPELFEAIAKQKVNSSVWISGYYGSGKSHLLKMLSLVLNNKEINGNKSADIFGKKAEGDFDFEANIKKTSKTRNKAILFNISAKADGFDNSEGFTDRVLMVFLKALNESYGYHPIYPEIAEIERQLDQNGLFEQFKDNYYKQCKSSWESNRNDVSWHLNEFIAVYAATRKIDAAEARDIINQQRSNYKIDIETLANIVNRHCETDNHRIVFCVDEVGQFIADDIDKMLSLQTIAENLAVKTDGKSFIIATSQDDLDSTIGRFNQNQADTFSKIKARFSFRIPLTSANADEVIQKRLLMKTEEANLLLSKIYENEKNIISTLFKFSDDSKKYKNYQSVEHFQDTYPFIPYHFTLFQDSIKGLSVQDVFTGRSQSTGERSLLDVCHTVAKSLKDNDLETVVTFPMMFDAIKHDFRSQVYSDITAAGRGLISDLAVDVLKALLLVKYVKGFKATVNNIAILLLPRFNVDLAAFLKQIQEALNVLESQTYIQRSAGDLYEYLTNQEKEVENEIKNTDIDPTAPGELLSGYLFDEILKDTKVKLDTNNQPYEFGKKLDDNVINREKDFYVNFITPLNANSITVSNVNMFSIGRPNDLIVFLPEDKRLFDELRLIKRTEKYIQLNNSPSLEATKHRILSEKADQNQIRKRTVVNQLKESISDAKLLLNGSELTEIGSKDPKTKITQGVQQLIKTIYTNLKMLTVDFTEAHLGKIIHSQDDVLFKDSLHEVELEVLSRIQRNKGNHERTTVKNLIDGFYARPYGWYQTAVLCLIAKLYKRNKISLKQDGNNLDDRAVLDALQKSNQYANTIIELEEEIQNTQIQKLKHFHHEYFNEPNLGNEPKEISRLFKQRLEKEVKDLSDIYMLRNRFKFLEALGTPLSRLKLVAEKDHPYFFNALDQYQDDLLDDKENILEAVKKFMNGSQRSIFENVLLYLESNNANFDYIGNDSLEKLNIVSESAAPYKGNLMQEAKGALELIQKEVGAQQKTERETAIESINQSIAKLKSFADYAKLDYKQKAEVTAPFEKTIKDLEQERFIGNIRTKANTITTNVYQKQLELMMRLANPSKPEDAGSKEPAKPKVVFVVKDSIKVNFSKPALENRQDVEDYTKALKEQYLRIIEEHKRISL